MSYFSERHGIRRAIVQTGDISIDMYALLMDCCEKYFDNIAWKYPAQCPDGNGCCGIDISKLINDLRFTIPTLYGIDTYYPSLGWFSKPSAGTFGGKADEYDQYALLDFIEFIGENLRDINRKIWHSFYRHHDIDFSSSNAVFALFQDDINSIFKKTGLLYELTIDGLIERIENNGVLSQDIEMEVSEIEEDGLKELLQTAIALHKSPRTADHKDAVEKIWDALERLKSYHTDMDKKASAERIVEDMANRQSDFQILFDEEFRALTKIGNSFRIRHHETDKVDITDVRHHDYFFNRCLALIALAIQYL